MHNSIKCILSLESLTQHIHWIVCCDLKDSDRGDSDDEADDEQQQQHPRLPGALGSLALLYGEALSSSDQENETTGIKCFKWGRFGHGIL